MFSFLFGCGLVGPGLASLAAPAPNFTIAATNVTMPSGGSIATSPFTLTSVNSYAGQVLVSCAYMGDNMGARVPTCGIYTNPNFALGANQTVKGSLTLSPYGKVIPFSAVRPGIESPGVPALAAVVLCFLALGRRLRARGRWLALLILGLAGIGGITSCGSGLSGSFPYTVTAVDNKTNTSATATIMVTVP
ncbi:MAG TPA: hypothetical protein VGG62_08880 [Terracidiphilus sp.]